MTVYDALPGRFGARRSPGDPCAQHEAAQAQEVRNPWRRFHANLTSRRIFEALIKIRRLPISGAIRRTRYPGAPRRVPHPPSPTGPPPHDARAPHPRPRRAAAMPATAFAPPAALPAGLDARRARTATRPTTRAPAMTLRRPRGPAAADAVAAEFGAGALAEPHTVDAALAALLARGRRRARAEEAVRGLRSQVAALEMLTRVPLVADGRPTKAAAVLLAAHVAVPVLLAGVLRQDVEGVGQVLAYLSMR